MKNKIMVVTILLLCVVLSSAGCREGRTTKPAKEDKMQSGESDCLVLMDSIQGIYDKIQEEVSRDSRISKETEGSILKFLESTGSPVTRERILSNMSNYEKMDAFLKGALKGDKEDIILYELYPDGRIGRRQFSFDGKEMRELYVAGSWNPDGRPFIAETSYNVIKDWGYTEKGWFWCEYRVPEPPEVTEIVDGSVMFRVKPLKEEYREIAEKYVIPIAYQGNNLLRTNWSASDMNDIDYNGLYDYLYFIKYGQKYEAEKEEGIPKEEFEGLMMEYLPVTAEQLRLAAAFDEDSQRYLYAPLGCGNHTLHAFGTSVPEVTDIVQHEDGSMTLTVDAVCEAMEKDAVIRHKLTLEHTKDGGIRYLKNQILGDGLERIPAYKFRVGSVN